MADFSTFYLLGFGLVFAGVIILIIAVVLGGILRGRNGKVKAAGVIVVGPFPIIFGSDKKTVQTILKLAIVLTTMLVVLTLIYYFLLR